MIAAATRDLLGRFFQCVELNPIVIEKGREPVRAWHVIDEAAGLARFDALRRDGMLKLVGREAEIERLSQCWLKALHGSGQAVLLTGEAGIGKSRLVVELEQRLVDTPHAILTYSGSPYHADAPMSALVEELKQLGRVCSER